MPKQGSLLGQNGVNYPYQAYAGVPLGCRGLIALGLFADE